jgi:phosphatidylethanolamine/phosphatidyl-N-methylethanolamine N-methyltransferase
MSEDERRYWERHAKNYDRSMTLLGRPLPRMLELTAEAVRGAARVLEVAAGTGLVTRAIARTAGEVVATDYASAMVESIRARIRHDGLSNVRCEQADLYSLPFEAGAFDAVIAANVLHLVPDLRGALGALRRVVRPGGRIIVPTFCHAQTTLSRAASRLLALTGFPGHRRFTAAGLREELEAVGIRVTRIELISGVIPVAYAEGHVVDAPSTLEQP